MRRAECSARSPTPRAMPVARVEAAERRRSREELGRAERWSCVLAGRGRLVLRGDPRRARRGRCIGYSAARKTAASSLAEPADRVAAVRILGRGPDRHDDDLKLLATLLIPQSPLEVQLAAVDTISRLPHERVSEVLLSGWTNHGPKVHTAVVSVLLWREPWPGVLEEGSATARSWSRRWIGLFATSRCVILPRKSARAREVAAHPHQARNSPVARQVLSRPDDARGHRPRKKDLHRGYLRELPQGGRRRPACRSRLEQAGRPIAANLLVDTIDPNRVVDHRFIEFTALTASGLQISGMLLEETEDGITLADVKGESRVVLRKDLDELVSNHRSQMPEGLEANSLCNRWPT